MAIVSTVQVRGKTTFVIVVVSSLQREQSTPSNNVARSAGGGIVGSSMHCSCRGMDLARSSPCCIRAFSSDTRARAVLTRILNRSCPLDNSSLTFESDPMIDSPSTI